LSAYQAGEDPAVEKRANAISRALRFIPSEQHKTLLLAREALVKETSVETILSLEVQEAEKMKDQLLRTKTIADDTEDERSIIASGDYGSALAVGAYGLEKNVREAEKYLKRASEGKDAASARNYGHLLLGLGRSGEASQQFRHSADLGDKESVEILRQLMAEADEKREQAMNKLRTMADAGDERALEILREYSSSNQQTHSP